MDNMEHALSPIQQDVEDDPINNISLQNIEKDLDHIPEQYISALNNTNKDYSKSSISKKPAPLWGYPKQRKNYAHLINKTPCSCGAGNDLAFLYEFNQGLERYKENNNDPDKLPKIHESLIPTEYRIFKNKKILDLEYSDDKYTIKPCNHEKHSVEFPPMHPTNRSEVIQLKNVLVDLVKDNIKNDIKASNLSQMHNLVDIIHKEQHYYNVIFHEIIRQVTVECAERGQLLSYIRDLYNGLINRIPSQIKSLYDDMLAQRAHDRRLEEEIMSFKSTITNLTSELETVQEHDLSVTNEAAATQLNLTSAIQESKKNASLLSEYHELYELQRKRLNQEIQKLFKEKEMWSTGMYNLAYKIIGDNNLNLVKKLYLSDRSWKEKTVQIGMSINKVNSEILHNMKKRVCEFQNKIERMHYDLSKYFQEIKHLMGKMLVKMKQLHVVIKTSMNEMTIAKMNFLSNQDLSQMIAVFRSHSPMISDVNKKHKLCKELLSTDVIPSLKTILGKLMVDSSTLFNHFKYEECEEGHFITEEDDIQDLKKDFDIWERDINRIVKDDHNITAILIQINSIDLKVQTKSDQICLEDLSMIHQEVFKLIQLFEDLLNNFTDLESMCLSDKYNEKRILSHDLFKSSERWITSVSSNLQNFEEVQQKEMDELHHSMLLWLVQVLMHLACDQTKHSDEAAELFLRSLKSIDDLTCHVDSLFSSLEKETKKISQIRFNTSTTISKTGKCECAQSIMAEIQTECNDWISNAKLLLLEITGSEFTNSETNSTINIVSNKEERAEDKVSSELRQEVANVEGDSKIDQMNDDNFKQEIDISKLENNNNSLLSSTQENNDVILVSNDVTEENTLDQMECVQAPKSLVDIANSHESLIESDTHDIVPDNEKTLIQENMDVIEIIGRDLNTHSAIIDEYQVSDVVIDESPHSLLDSGTRELALETLKAQISSSEMRAQEAEKRAYISETELSEALDTISLLEAKIDKLSAKIEQENGKTENEHFQNGAKNQKQMKKQRKVSIKK